MNPLILITLLAVVAAANQYGSYGHSEPQITVRVQEPARSSYSAPQRQESYSAPDRSSYSAPQKQESYSAPSRSSYSAPQKQESYSAPALQRQESSGSSYSIPTPQQIPIHRFNQEIRGSESSSTDFEAGNGIKSTFNTKVVRGRPSSYTDDYGQPVQSDSSLEMSGHSYHQAPEGQHISLTRNADENGFRASGDHLPKPVKMPAEHAEAHRQALEREQNSGYSSYSSSARSYAQQPMRSGY